MPAPYVTAADVVAQMAAARGQADGAVPPAAVSVKAMLAASYTNVRLVLLLAARGYGPAEVDRWAGIGPTALIHATVKCHQLLAAEPAEVDAWRRELEAIEEPFADPAFALTDAAGLVIGPASPSQGATAATGSLTAAAATYAALNCY